MHYYLATCFAENYMEMEELGGFYSDFLDLRMGVDQELQIQGHRLSQSLTGMGSTLYFVNNLVS